MAFTDTSVLSRSYAARLRQEVDQNHELAVLGVANIATGLFQGFPISTSSSRTAVVENVGAEEPDRRAVGRRRARAAADPRDGAGGGPADVLARRDRDGRGGGADRRPRAASARGLAALGVRPVDAGVRRRGAGRRAVGRRHRDRGLAAQLHRRAWRPHDAGAGSVDNLKGDRRHRALSTRGPSPASAPGRRRPAPLFFGERRPVRERSRGRRGPRRAVDRHRAEPNHRR